MMVLGELRMRVLAFVTPSRVLVAFVPLAVVGVITGSRWPPIR